MRRVILFPLLILFLAVYAERGLALSCAMGDARIVFGCDESGCQGYTVAETVLEQNCDYLEEVITLDSADLQPLHENLQALAPQVGPMGTWQYAGPVACYYALTATRGSWGPLDESCPILDNFATVTSLNEDRLDAQLLATLEAEDRQLVTERVKSFHRGQNIQLALAITLAGLLPLVLVLLYIWRRGGWLGLLAVGAILGQIAFITVVGPDIYWPERWLAATFPIVSALLALEILLLVLFLLFHAARSFRPNKAA